MSLKIHKFISRSHKFIIKSEVEHLESKYIGEQHDRNRHENKMFVDVNNRRSIFTMVTVVFWQACAVTSFHVTSPAKNKLNYIKNVWMYKSYKLRENI